MLLLSVLLDGPLHPWAIQQVLQEHAETFTFGNDSVYTSLRRLEHKGLVSSIKVLVSGRTRRVFEITPAGREQLAPTGWCGRSSPPWSAKSCTITRMASARSR